MTRLVAAVDAMVWHGAGPGVIERWAHLPEWGQLLLRAAIYRLGVGEDDVADAEALASEAGAWERDRYLLDL